MSACPEIHDLQAFVDGQLDAAPWRDVDRHQRDCADCRDALRSIARLNRELMRPAPLILPADFEERFREGLYDRMVATDDVGRLRRLQRRDLALAGAIAALLVVALSLAIRLGDTESEGGSEAPAPELLAAARLEPGPRLRAELAGYLDRLGPAGPERGDPLLDGLASSYAAVGRNLVHDLAEEAAVSSADRESAALMTLARLGDPAGAQAISRHINDDLPPGPRLEAALRALVLTGVPGTAKRIVTAEADGLSVASALDLLDACDRPSARRLMARLARDRMVDRREETVRALSALRSQSATRVLVDLAFIGQTSTLVAEALQDRPGVREELRRRAQSRRVATADRQRAIELLGILRDTESRGVLVSLSRRPEFAGPAATALAGLDGVEALGDLLHLLDVDSDRDIESLLANNADSLARIAALSSEGAVAIRQRLDRPGGHRRAAYILALGCCGDASDLDRLMTWARSPEFEQVALAALVLLDLEESRDFLHGLLRNRDGDLRRLAREAMRLLEWEVKPTRRWSGYAAAPRTDRLAMAASRMA